MRKLCAILLGIACVLLFVLVCEVGATWMRMRAADLSPESPIRSIEVVVPPGKRDKFVEQLRAFADANAFAMRVGNVTPDGKRILVQMWREDIKVIGDNPFEPEAFGISFYRNGTAPVWPWAFDKLVTNLKGQLGDVQGASVSDKE
jgi:hypothetical protein